MNQLNARLEDLPPDKADAVRARIWKEFHGTDAYMALLDLLHESLAASDAKLLAPDSSPHSRSYSAGGSAAVRRILTTIGAAISFDPADAVYANSTQPDFNFDSEDYTPEEDPDLNEPSSSFGR